MADKLDGSAIVANTIPSNRIQSSSITQTQLQPALYTTITQATHPKIRSLTYPGNDTAANTGGGDTIVVNGTGFGNTGNVQIYINGNVVSSITVTNANSVSFTAPALSAATYPLYLINTSDGSTAILIPGIQYSGVPTWTTTTPLTSQDATGTWNIQLVATSDSTISYSLQSGSSLPAGITLAANGLISGTMTSPPTDETTYNFTVVANDLEQQDASRAFSVSVTVGVLDPYVNYTTLLLHGDGTNNANNHAFVDSSNNAFTITRNGNASQGTFSPFGDNWSNFFDGNGDYLSFTGSSNLTAAGDFTFECWVFVRSIAQTGGSNPRILTSASGLTLVLVASTNNLRVDNDSNATSPISTSNDSIKLNQWMHIAVVRSGSTLTAYLNGVNSGSATHSTTFTETGTITIGYTTAGPGGYFDGYISNMRMVVGTALYTANFTPTTQPLTAIANTQLLTCQSNAFVDKGPNRYALTRGGDVKVSKFDPFKPYKAIPASYGVYFDGTGDYLDFDTNAAFTMGTGDFTIELWYLSNTSYAGGNGYLFDLGTNGTRVQLYLNQLYFLPVAGSGVTSSAGVGMLVGTWYHLACVRSGSTITVYLNGVSIGSVSNSSNLTDNDCRIAAYGGGGLAFNGHISNFRIVKGTAVYTSTFTPSTSPLTAVANTSLLTCQSTTIIDNSTNAFTITRNGDARPTDLNPFTTTFVSEKYNTANGGGAVYVDGTGDYLTVPNNAALQFGAGDFTVECWVYCARALNSGTNALFSIGSYNDGLYLRLNGGSSDDLYINGSYWSVPWSTYMSPNAWAHVVVTRSGTALRVFVNGNLALNTTNSSTISQGSGTTIAAATHNTTEILLGYISNFRILKGRALYTVPFVPPSAPLTAVANTQLLCNFTNAGILDSVGKNVLETVGDARVNTSVKKYGTGSMYFDGNGDVLIGNPSQFTNYINGTSDWTYEFWIYYNALPTGGTYGASIYAQDDGAGVVSPFNIVQQGNTWKLWADTGAGTWDIFNNVTLAATSLTTSTWYHIAFVRTSGTLRMFVNGVQVASTALTASIQTNTSRNLWLFGTWQNNPSNAGGINGYVDEVRLTKGVARYRYSFTPPTKAFNDGDGNLANNTTDVLVGDSVNLPVFPYTTLLLHGDGTNNANNHAFLDSSNNAFAITRNGNATQGTFSPFSPTGWSVNIPDGSYYTTNTALMNISSSSQTFTAEAWIYPTAINSSGPQNYRFTSIFSKGIVYLSFGFTSGGVLRFYTYNGSENYINSAAGLIKTNEWQHVAVVSNAGSITLYYNGISVATGSLVVPNGGMSEVLKIGHGDTTNNYQPDRFIGYMSNLRITNTAVYTAAFTPSIIPLTSISGTQLLTFKNNRLLDNSNNSYSITVNGTPSIEAFSPFAPSVEYTANTHGGSAYFDGTGDYLTGPNNSAVSTSGGNYLTCEAWIYPTSHGSERTVFFRLQLAGSYPGYILRLDNGFPLLGSSSNDLTSNTAAQLNAWNHVAFVFDSSGNQTIYLNGVRTATRSNGPTTMDYSANLIIGGDGTGTRNFFGYIADARIIKQSTAYYSGATITVPTAPFTAITNTSLLLNCTNAGILDSTGKNVLETVGDARVNTAIKKYGTGSMYFDGTGDGLRQPTVQNLNWFFGSGDMTIECWAYFNSVSGYQTLLDFRSSGGGFGTSSFVLWVDAGTLSFFAGAYSGGSPVLSGGSISTGQWYHIVVSRYGGTTKLFLNGNQTATTTTAWAQTFSATDILSIGATTNVTGNYLNGYIDDLRITKGIARYVNNFTPPTAAFLNK
jgi:hypothetical protein